MTNTQLYLAIAVPVVFNAALLLMFKWGVDAKFRAVNDQPVLMNNRLESSLEYLVDHHGKIEKLDERTKKL